MAEINYYIDRCEVGGEFSIAEVIIEGYPFVGAGDLQIDGALAGSDVEKMIATRELLEELLNDRVKRQAKYDKLMREYSDAIQSCKDNISRYKKKFSKVVKE